MGREQIGRKLQYAHTPQTVGNDNELGRRWCARGGMPGERGSMLSSPKLHNQGNLFSAVRRPHKYASLAYFTVTKEESDICRSCQTITEIIADFSVYVMAQY